ncbi:MAG TPA: diacylglycerol kinase family protein [Streptosporangiaceae bacterium]|nr:diacylglycerol kinase family protein [Streptosporangiaceae bacterium]
MMRRAAAALALVTAVAAAGLLLFGVVLHVVAVLAGIISMLVVVTAGWYAVSRRGLRRAVALIVMVLAVAGLATALVFEDLNGIAAGLAIAASSVSVTSARYALRPPAGASHETRSRPRAVMRPGRGVLIMNLRSGGGKAERFHLADECQKRGIEPVVLRPGDDLLELAQDAVDRGADVIGMAGGDGSQALVATVASRRGVPHVCVPAGTRNHFALDLGLDRADVVGALDGFTDGVDRRIDLGTVNGRVFVNNASLGLYAKVVQSPQYRDAKVSTAAAMLPDLLGPDAQPLDLRFSSPDGDYPTAHLILVSNDPYKLDQIGGLGTRERLDRGVLGIVAARIADAAQARRFVALQAAGQIRRFPGWKEWSARRFEVASGGPVEIGIDGEAMLMDPPLVFESLPGALTVRLPRRAAHRGARERTVHMLDRSTFSELARMTVGR